MGPDDRGAAPSDLAATNGYVKLAGQLRELEDKTLRLPVLYAGGGGGGDSVGGGSGESPSSSSS